MAEEISTELTARASTTAGRRAFDNVWAFVRQNRLSAFFGVIGFLLVIMAIAAPLTAPYDPTFGNFAKILSAPDSENWFGTDRTGRDYLSRIIYGARSSLVVSLLAVGLGTTFGAAVGLAGGYLGGKFDLISQRSMELLMAIPGVILAMLLVVGLGANFTSVIIAIAATRIAVGGRVVRSVALAVKEMPYVDAARAIGASPIRIMMQHIAPQCVAVYLIIATTHLGAAIIIEASLGFLGLGIPPPTPTWGNMLGDALEVLRPQWWLVVYPGLFITITVLSFNILGDGLRDALDPRLRGSRE